MLTPTSRRIPLPRRGQARPDVATRPGPVLPAFPEAASESCRVGRRGRAGSIQSILGKIGGYRGGGDRTIPEADTAEIAALRKARLFSAIRAGIGLTAPNDVVLSPAPRTVPSLPVPLLSPSCTDDDEMNMHPRDKGDMRITP